MTEIIYPYNIYPYNTAETYYITYPDCNNITYYSIHIFISFEKTKKKGGKK